MAERESRRSYDDACGAAHALDLVGERWALLVVRELLLGPRRFTDLRAGLPGISPNVLTQRLEDLEAAGVALRRRLPPPAAAWVYDLTEWGRGLEDVIVTLGRWGARSPARPKGSPISTTSLILSMRTMFDAAAAEGVTVRIALHVGEARFHADISGGRLSLLPGDADRPDAMITLADPGALAAVLYDGRDLAEARAAGSLHIEGDRVAVRRFVRCFRLPAPATLPRSAAPSPDIRKPPRRAAR